MKLSYCSYGVI